ncbi:hypothetical protein [Parvibaculum sp.]|uniref:hypothetical protein n=1 Tax=Parvibaculum sp. TaxID=2024848 RepID=UPI00391D107B
MARYGEIGEQKGGDMFFGLRKAICIVLILLASGAWLTADGALARPAPMSAEDHAAALAFIEETGAAMKDAETALDSEESNAEAAARRDDLGTRLETLRRMMTDAAQRDRIGAKGGAKNRNVTPERTRARDVIARGGAMEERLQDLWTLWSQRARGDASGCLGAAGYRPC